VVDCCAAQRVAVLYVTHKLDEVFRFCERVTVLRDGRRRAQRPGGRHHPAAAGGHHARPGHRRRARARRHHVHRRAPQRRRRARPARRGLTAGRVLDDVTVDVHAGEVVGLAGLLGSGRTETAKAMFGADPVDSGSVSVDGRTRRRWSPAAAIRNGVGMIPEDRKAEGVIAELSVRDNIVLAALPRLTTAGFLSDRRQADLVDTFVKRLRIKVASTDQKVRELSGGNQQKVLLARMLCLHPKVLILDEPTRGVDVGAKAEIQSLIDELGRAGPRRTC
jgi:ribose transport system ATP-binding protein